MSNQPTPIYNPGAHAFKGRRRKGKSHNGVDWAPPTIQDPSTGPYCKNCHKRHRWKDSHTQYDKRNAGWYLMWVCKKSGLVMEEVFLGAQKRS